MDLAELSRDQLVDLVQDAAKLWLAHDGLWFQAVEQHHGLDHAIELDGEAWQRFTVLEAKRIMKRLGLQPGGGLDALALALDQRLYALLNDQEIVEHSAERLVFRMKACRVQVARERKGLAAFPCKPVGLIEYSGFARTIDPRIETRCLHCPPDPRPTDAYCAWEFTLA